MGAVLYLIMRNDLPSLNPGKLAAQAAHCANAAVARARGNSDPLLEEWEAQSRQDFGTTIVLGAPLGVIKSLFTSTSRIAPVWDDSYPCEIPLEVADILSRDSVDSDDLAVRVKGWRVKGWRATVLDGSGIFLRREIVGAYVLAAEKPDELKNLELYP